MIDQEFLPEHFINRELSWLEFNARVLEEAQDASNPLLERAKFLAIFSSNFDEFFMVRVAGLREQAFGDGAPQDVALDGQRAITQLQNIARRTQELVAAESRCWKESVRPALAAEDILLLGYDELNGTQREKLHRFFRERAFPVLTPMAIDPSHPTPRFHNRGVYLGVTLKRTSALGPKRLFAVVQLPSVLPRFVPIGDGDEHRFILLEDVIAARLPELFGGFKVLNWTTFRITRDMDIDLLEQEADDMLLQIERRIRARQRAEAVRLEVQAGASDELLEMLIREEGLRSPSNDETDPYTEVYTVDGPLDMTALFELVKLPGLESLRDPPLVPKSARDVPARCEKLFAAIAARDVLLHHPYDAFDPVVDFIEQAANDPDVLAIKQTLYRTSGDSPIVRALMQAAENGKQVTALVELKARFDEESNVSWARQMERAGVHVVFGFLDLKTHCKVAMVVRREGGQLRRYVHLGTGNYNPTTALIYTDLGLFTANPEITNDATALFNLLTGYSQGHRWEKLIVAPKDMERRTIELIDEQAERALSGYPAWVFAKLNALVDPATIEALYRASHAGVRIDLLVRGMCCLRPQLPGISDNIRVRSIVDRFLEHSRIYVFGPQEEAKVFLASADWMPRNFRRRVEVMFPIEASKLKKRILTEIIPVYLRDNARTRHLLPDGTYERARPNGDEVEYRAQEDLIGPPVKAASPEPAPGKSDSNGATEPAKTPQEVIS